MSILDNPDGWPPDSRECVFLARALANLPHDAAWTALKSGKLTPRVYRVGRSDWGPVPISLMAFVGAERAQVFATCQIEVRDKDTRRPDRQRPLIPVPHWLYVTQESLDRLLERQPVAGAQKKNKQGSGSYAKADQALYPEMKKLIDLNEARSANDAARMFASQAKGAGTSTTKADRLARGYRKWTAERP
jgi:hypothetical protein